MNKDSVEVGHHNTGIDNIGLYNTGDCNIGDCNSGNCNIGDCNTGNRNIGKCNVGHRNTGFYNAGECNTGRYNIGKYNVGDGNIGQYNTGDCNVGDWNAGNCNTGIFCTDEPKFRVFNKESNLTHTNWIHSRARYILKTNSKLTEWIHSKRMSEEEKKNNPKYKIMGGYLKVFTFEEMCKNMWNNLTEEEKKIIMDIPNFDVDIFKKITGIDII